MLSGTIRLLPLCCAALLLAGCGTTPPSSDAAASACRAAAPQPAAFALQGMELKAAGYGISWRNGPEQAGAIEPLVAVQDTSPRDNPDGELRGGYTGVFVKFQYQYGTDLLLTALLQAYPLPLEEGGEFRVGNHVVAADEYDDYLIYRDEHTLILDWLPLLDPERTVEETIRKRVADFNEKLRDSADWPADRTVPEPLNAEDYSALFAVEPFLREHLARMIVAQDR